MMKTGNTHGRKDGGNTQEGRGKYDILDMKRLKFLCNLQLELSIRQLDICLSSSGDTRVTLVLRRGWRGPGAEGGRPSPWGWFCLSKHLTEARERLIYNCCVVREPVLSGEGTCTKW